MSKVAYITCNDILSGDLNQRPQRSLGLSFVFLNEVHVQNLYLSVGRPAWDIKRLVSFYVGNDGADGNSWGTDNGVIRSFIICTLQ